MVGRPYVIEMLLVPCWHQHRLHGPRYCIIQFNIHSSSILTRQVEIAISTPCYWMKTIASKERQYACKIPQASASIRLGRWPENSHVEEILSHQLHDLLNPGQQKWPVFSYAAPIDHVTLFISGIAAIIAGALNPILTVSLSINIKVISNQIPA